MSEKNPMRAGEGSVEPTDIPTASIDQQIAALQRQREELLRQAAPTFEEYVRLPWTHNGAGLLKSASGVCVVILAGAYFQPHDYAVKRDAEQRLAAMVLTAVNCHADLLAALKAIDNLSQFMAGDCFEIPADEWRDAMALVRAAQQKAQGL